MTAGAPLRALVHDVIREKGSIPFDEFMDLCLYHPVHGYYCRPGMTTGPSGDFYTSPDLHPAFGLLVGRQIAEIEERTRTNEPVPFHIIEAGPGTGRLARDIIAGLAEEYPALARRVIYTLVEISPSLKRLQAATIEAGGGQESVAGLRWLSWSEVLGDLRATAFHGCVVANEFLDALPVQVVERREAELLELHVASNGVRFAERLLPPRTPALAEHLWRLGVELEEGQRAEIGLNGLEWVGSLGRLFGEEGRGGAILIDYGHTSRDLYTPSRGRGTLLSYHRHQVVDDPYTRAGDQDMTAHVDFTAVSRRAREAGFDVAPLATQMRFLVSLGLAEILADLASREDQGAGSIRQRMALHGLMAPGGMGEVFKVLLLSRETSAAGLTGAKDPFR